MIEIDAVFEFYGGDIPGYITDIGTDSITIRHNNVLDETIETVITMRDVCNYFAYDARDIMSGCRSISTFTGDWRNVDAVAQEMHELLKFCCNEEYKKLINDEYSEIMAPGW